MWWRDSRARVAYARWLQASRLLIYFVWRCVLPNGPFWDEFECAGGVGVGVETAFSSALKAVTLIHTCKVVTSIPQESDPPVIAELLTHIR